MPARPVPVGELLREWRRRRRLSQLDLAGRADVSTRHLSFVESGRSAPSRDLLLNLAERLGVPLRDRNILLTAAGYAPDFPARPLDDPALAAARRAVEQVVQGHDPFPALAVDRDWTLVTANPAAARLLAGVDPGLLRPPANVLRLALHPAGLAPRVENLAEWRAHLLARLDRDIDNTAAAALVDLRRELGGYPAGGRAVSAAGGVAVTLRLASPAGPLALISATTVFGTPNDVTLSELALETFHPADAATADRLRAMASA